MTHKDKRTWRQQKNKATGHSTETWNKKQIEEEDEDETATTTAIAYDH